MEFKCEKCGETSTKEGKMFGTASVQSSDTTSSLVGSELAITFCPKCGHVIELKVKDPDKIK